MISNGRCSAAQRRCVRRLLGRDSKGESADVRASVGVTHADADAATPTPSSTPSPTPKPSPTFTVGQTQQRTVDGPGFSATVFGYTQPITLPYNQPETAGNAFAYANVQVCVGASPTGQPFQISESPWTLTFADNTQAQPSNAGYTGEVDPYPFVQALSPNSCIRGNILFEVPANERPTRITYTVQSQDGSYDIRTWTIPAA